MWGEERDKDAIHTVYLKKVRYHRPIPTVTNNVSSRNISKKFPDNLNDSLQNESDDEISHLEWETVRVRFVKAATLDRLVDALITDDGELESTFVNVFLGEFIYFKFC